MSTYAVRYTQPLLGAANAAGYLVAVPGASILVRQNGVACTVYSSRAKAAMTNPVPTGVPPGTAGVDTLGNLMLYMEPGDGYDFVATVGATSVTVALPAMPADYLEPLPPAAVSEAMLAFGVATQDELDAGLASKAPSTGIAQAAVTNLVSDLAGKQATIPPGTYVAAADLTAGLATKIGPGVTLAGAAVGTVMGAVKVTADAHDRWRLDAGGRVLAGDGTAAPVQALNVVGLSVGIGRFALGANSASENVGVGTQALRYNTTGTYNTGVGRDALVNNTVGQQNTALGFAAQQAATGSFNTAVGASALVNATGQSNTAVGVQALQSLTSGAPNTAVGSQALQLCTTGSFNTAIGQAAMDAATTASYCVAVGQDALGAVTTATDCTAIGEAAMPANTTGYGNTAVGHGALRDNTTGAANVAIGVVTLQSSNTDGNTAVGQNALQQATTGTLHTAVGYRAGSTPNSDGTFTTTTGTRQTLLGALTGQSSATQRDDIVCLGYAALAGGNGAVSVGSGAQALHANSVALGMGTVTTATNQVACGARAVTATSAALTGALTAASATLTGAMVSGTTVRAQSGVAAAEVSLGTFGPGGEAGIAFGTAVDAKVYRRIASEVNVALGSTESARFSVPASGDTAGWLLVNDGAVTSLRRVTVGATDSGGAGKRQLVVAN